jgi:hypothetical protein
MPDRSELAARLNAATGADGDLDGALATVLGLPPAPYTASVDSCRALVASAMPGWRLHLGYGASGIFPYATLSTGGRRHMADAPTVPLAILRVVMAGLADSATEGVATAVPVSG